MKKLAFIVAVLLSFTGCEEAPREDLVQTTYALGTVITINLYDQGNQELMNQLIARVTEIEALMSAQQDTSEISEVRRMAGLAPVKVSEETFDVIKKALYYAELSGGKFDPTIGPVVDLWGIGTEEARVPEDEEIQEALELVGYEKLVLDEEAMTVYLTLEGMSLDLGGIAKGYAADELVVMLRNTDVERAMINLGGNIFAYGEKKGGEAYKVAVQTPYDSRNTYFGYVEVKDMAVVTSGPYERYIEENGQIYHHIFDATRGYPVSGDVVSTTIVAPNAMDADALSTLLFTMSPEEGLALIEKMNGTDCLYVDRDFGLVLSGGVKDNFTVTDNQYQLNQ